jgi:hypothetical protein
MFWIAPMRVGDLRPELAEQRVTRLSSPDGNTSGTVNGCGASNFGSSARAWRQVGHRGVVGPVSGPRPKCAPVVTASNQETDSAYFVVLALAGHELIQVVDLLGVDLEVGRSTWCSASNARTTTSEAIPATVAQNRSSSGVARGHRHRPDQRAVVAELPTTVALPWMSAPISRRP